MSGNAVLDRLREQRNDQFSFIDQLMARVAEENRDLVEAEQSNLDAARERITALDKQISPLAEYEKLRQASSDGNPLPGPRSTQGDPRPLAAGGDAPAYASAGSFIVDMMRAKGVPWATNTADRVPNPDAAARVQRAAVQNQTTDDTPGILPAPIVGPIVGVLDSARPFVASLSGGARSMAGIPGSTFSRPRITQHVQVGKQAAQKTELPSRQMVIGSVPFAKETFGGTVDVSRQVIDWTSPSAWDALIQDLAGIYGWETDHAAANDLATKVVQTSQAATNDLPGWAAALYDAAVKAYLGGSAVGTMPKGALPDRVWLSVDMWGKFGGIVDPARMAAFANAAQALGPQELTNFAGNILGAPRVVVPSFPANTIIVGSSTMYEAYEEVIGLLSAVEPALLGIEVAYGGYFAYAPLDVNAFCKVLPPPVGP